MTRIILARHGETDWNKHGRVQGGKSDIPLNDYGKRQAENARDYLKQKTFDAVYASPLCRTQETARIITNGRGLEIITSPNLAEIDAGEYEGILTSELGRRFSVLISELDKNAELPRAPGGESLSMVQERSWQVIEEISRAHRGQNILVVTHYFVILAIICKILDIPLINTSRLHMATGSLSVISFSDSVPRLEGFNFLP